MKKKLLFLLTLVFILTATTNVYAKNRVNITINEDYEIEDGFIWNEDANQREYNFEEYITQEDETLTIIKDADYIINSQAYDFEIKQTINTQINLSLWNNGNLTLDKVNIYSNRVTANGEMVIKDSKLNIEGFYGDEGSVNAEEDIIIDNSEINCMNSIDPPGSPDLVTSAGNIHSYYGDITIKNNSKISVDGRIYVDDGSISISDSNVKLNEKWGYMEAPTDIMIKNSDITFSFGIQGGEEIQIINSNITAIEKESIYARESNDSNQGWIQVSDGKMTIKDSTINVVNSITSTDNMEITKSNITLSGNYSNNGYIQSGNKSIKITDSNITADKDIYAGKDIDITSSEIKITGEKSKKGYLEAHNGKMNINNSKIEVDEGIISEEKTVYSNSNIKATGKNSERGYIEVDGSSLDIIKSEVNTNEKLTVKEKTTINNSNIHLSSGIITNGLELNDSDFYASNKNTSKMLSNYSPVLSTKDIYLKNTAFIAESVNKTPSIASLGKITIINDSFKNKAEQILEIIEVSASEADFINDDMKAFINEGDKVYTTAINHKISNYSAIGKKEIINPKTGRIGTYIVIIGIMGIGLTYQIQNKKKKNI